MFENEFGQHGNLDWSPYAGHGGDAAEALLPAISIFFGILLLFTLLLTVLFYVFRSIGLYGMAKSCRLPAPGLAWVPIANLYVIGALAETGCRTYGKKPLPYRGLLLGGAILNTVCGFAVGILCGALFSRVFFNLTAGNELSDEALAESLLYPLPAFLLIVFLVSALSIALAVLEYMALYQIYKLFAPENAVLYTVLSVLLSCTTPFLLFSLRRRQPGAPAGFYAAPPAAPGAYPPGGGFYAVGYTPQPPSGSDFPPQPPTTPDRP